MLVGNPIRSLTQVECGESSSDGALSREPLVWLLGFEANEIGRVVIARNLLHDHLENPLLHVLHTSRFDGDDTRSFQCLGDVDDPYRSLVPRFEDANAVSPLQKGLGWYEVLPMREATFFQPLGPLQRFVLRVSAKLLCSDTGTMLGKDRLLIDTRVYRREESSP